VGGFKQSNQAEEGEERYFFHGALQDVQLDGFVG
jgi:hypothetical protein